MCGIFARVFEDSLVDNFQYEGILKEIASRGPDIQEKWISPLLLGKYRIFIYASVLHLRGSLSCKQPVISDRGDVFCFNGQVFASHKPQLQIHTDENDTHILSNWLFAQPSHERAEKLMLMLKMIEGPFSLFHWDALTLRLYFARDYLGRRSLLMNQNEKNELLLSSVAYPDLSTKLDIWTEIPARTLFCVDVNKGISLESIGEFEINRFGEQQRLKMPLMIPSAGELLNYDENGFPVMSYEMTTLLETTMRILTESVRRRITNIPSNTNSNNAARVAILFSGGLDCSCLATLVHTFIPGNEPIDLLNVAFENPRSVQARSNKKNTATNDIYAVPDRLTGRMSVGELRKRYPGRQWNFVEINVPYSEYLLYRPHIIRLMYPSKTIMDLSIAAALWFAGRGTGTLWSDSMDMDPPPSSYQSTAKVLISGLGADELLAGYSRHRHAFSKPSSSENPIDSNEYISLIKSLQEDLDRLPTRNLGRDDRVLSSLGKEVRFPFLDEQVVKHIALDIPIQWKCDLRESLVPREIGGKLWLRLLVREYLGPTSRIIRTAKRAMQFGARTAKFMQSSERGDDLLPEYLSNDKCLN